MKPIDHPVTEICADLAACYPNAGTRAIGLEVAEILRQLSMPANVIRVGFVSRRYNAASIPPTIMENLNDEEQALLDDLKKISMIDELHENPQQNIERLRQMLLAMANDIRVIVIKLALQLIDMRYLSSYAPAKRRQLALQTRDIQAPLANRLGIAKLKWELEDLALRELEPTTYRLIATSLVEQRKERESYVNQVVTDLTEAIIADGIDKPRVYGRAKHINSIFNKMKKKNKSLEEIYDLLAIRVQVETLKDCYAVLGIVHAMWQHIPTEFDDYIANPKPNGYQSLHTAVIGPEGKTIEIQIRTNEMHDYAELGVAAHWRYKEGSTGKVTAFERQINWLRSLLNEPDDTIAEEFTTEITEDRVYVITPQGKVIDLPNGATPLDFAYRIHTDLGHRTKGAKINGQLAPITHVLKTGETVEILAGKKNQPSRDWLNPHAGYLKSSRAKAKVKHFFKQLERDKAITEGEGIIEKQLAKLGIPAKSKYLKRAAKKFNYRDISELHAAIGFGDIGLVSVINYIESISAKKYEDLNNIPARLARIPIRHNKKKKNSVMIEGIDDLLISIASCCTPVAPEPITGYITKTKGISIHHRDCPNIQALGEKHPDNILDIAWSHEQTEFSTTLHIQAQDRIGLIKDISHAITNEQASIQKADFSRDDDMHVSMHLQVTVKDTDHLAGVLKKIRKVKKVQSVTRTMSST
ncbi:MAG: GTP pyrophosphokinase [Gammaproteobacteria bacterium]|nr:MAG: GTP pyrophosphokinase [Gammaproteobacteria bacterium]